MLTAFSRILCSAAFAAVLSGSAVAQDAANAPRADVNEAAEAGSQGDSATSLADEARNWIGQRVETADGTELGTLEEVADIVSDSSESGQLIVERPDGSYTEVELQGAASDGEVVTVTEPARDYEEEEVEASEQP